MYSIEITDNNKDVFNRKFDWLTDKSAVKSK